MAPLRRHASAVKPSGASRAFRFLGVGIALFALMGTTLTGCQSKQFRVDRRIHFTSPKERSKVKGAVTFAWTYKDFTPAPANGIRSSATGLFALFVDEAPIKPGHSLSSVIKKDAACVSKEKTCLDAASLANHNVYLTTSTSVTVSVLPEIAATGKIEDHQAILILVDGAGYRMGESAWNVDFRTNKRAY